MNGRAVSLSYIQLDILTGEMFKRLGPADRVMGLALGAGPNRKYVYVSYSRADALFLEEVKSTRTRNPAPTSFEGTDSGTRIRP